MRMEFDIWDWHNPVSIPSLESAPQIIKKLFSKMGEMKNSLFVSMQDEYKVLINLGSSGPSLADNFISGLIQKPYLAAKCAVLCSISWNMHKL